MLRAIDISAERTGFGTDSITLFQRRRPVRLLVIHNGDPRLAALDSLLLDLGYDAAVLTSGEAARGVLDNEGPPDILITTCDNGMLLRGRVFARECLARYPSMQALYVSWMPWAAAGALGPRERVLWAPFTAAGLTAAVATAAAPAWASVNSA